MPDTIPEVAYTKRTYTLVHKGDKCQWRTNDGIALSPEFTTLQCAMRYQQRMPMISDGEWIEKMSDGYPSGSITFSPDARSSRC